jgi:hypothetical protein
MFITNTLHYIHSQVIQFQQDQNIGELQAKIDRMAINNL